MSKVAVVIADRFEDSEYGKPAEALQKTGRELVHVGLKSGATVKGAKKVMAIGPPGPGVITHAHT